MPLQDTREWLQITAKSTKRAFPNLMRTTSQEYTRPLKFNTNGKSAVTGKIFHKKVETHPC